MCVCARAQTDAQNIKKVFNSRGLGVVFQDSQGDIGGRACIKVHNISSPKVVEALALWPKSIMYHIYYSDADHIDGGYMKLREKSGDKEARRRKPGGTEKDHAFSDVEVAMII